MRAAGRFQLPFAYLPVRLARTPGPLGLFSYFVLQPACVYVVGQYGVHLKACSSIGAVRARSGATCTSVLVYM